MTHKFIFEAYKAILPSYANATESWKENGKHCIRVRLINRQQFIFTFNSDKDWCFETVDHHNKRTKKGVH